MQLSSIHAVVFDLDGTIYCGNHLIDGASKLLEHLYQQGMQIYFCTNNSTKTRQEICAKLNALDVQVLPQKIYSAAYSAASYLKQHSYSDVYCLGNPGLHSELRSFGISIVSDPEKASVVLIGLDPSINYERISRLLPLRNKDCYLITCNRDKFFPSDNGKKHIGCGFITSLVEEVLDRKIDYTVGKPNTYMLDMLTAEHGLAMDEIVMVGDSLESDIAMANAAGCQSIYLSAQQGEPGVSHVTSLHELRLLFK